MSRLRFLTMILALFSAPYAVRSQTVPGRSFITGFELGSLAESSVFGNSGTVQSGIVRSGSFAYRANPIASNQRIAFMSRGAGGAGRPIFKSSRFYLYIGQLPMGGSVSIVKLGGAATLNPEIDLNWDGSLILADSWYPVIAKSQKSLSADGAWHRVEFDVGYGLRVYVDGELWAAGGTAIYPAAGAILFGAGESPTYVNATADLYFDDILVDAGSFSASGLPGDGHAALLKPIGDPPVLNSWIAGGGANIDLWMPVHNVPVAGRPASSATDMSQIKNSSQKATLDYKPSIQSYSNAGIPSGAIVNAVMAISNDGQESAKGKTKSGSVWIDQNPAQPAGGYSFDFGDSAGVIGMFPSGWTSHYGPVTSNPAVDLLTSPVVALRKSSGSDVDVDFLGVYVDWQ